MVVGTTPTDPTLHPLIVGNTYEISNVDEATSGPAQRAHIDLLVAPSKKTHIKVLFDTGASVSLITPKDLQTLTRHGRVLNSAPHNVGITNASKQPMTVTGCYRIRTFYNGRDVTGHFLVCPDAANSILGMNIIRPYAMILDPVSMQVVFRDTIKTDGDPFPVNNRTETAPVAAIRTLKRQVLEPRSAHLVKMAIFDSAGKQIKRKFTGIADLALAAVAFTTDDNGVFAIHVPNAHHEQSTLPRNTELGHAYHLDDFQPLPKEATVNAVTQHKQKHPLRPHTPKEKEEIKARITEQVRQHVPYQWQQEYVQMLMTKEHHFSADPHDLGFTTVQEHKIELADTNPVFTPQFRLPAEHLKMIQENVAGWLEAGIIERSSSPYNSPIFCVPKKQGSGLRCVLDYRKLNHNSLSDKYSIRTIDQCLETIGRARSSIFSCLDLTNGYWQLKLRDTDHKYTAFTIPGVGQFQWSVTPQGLMGAPASFSRLMDVIMEDAENVITYIDDVLVHSATHKDHLRHLAAAIDKVGAANLRLNPKKCIFGSSNVEYLGHTITAQGVQPGSDKALAVKQATPPTDKRTLKSFLGLANYFRTFINKFSHKAAPLYALTSSTAKWKGGNLPDEAMKAFKLLQAEIASRPVMAYPNKEGKFHLYVDAALGDSKHQGGLGAVLMQDQPAGVKRPVAFASRRLTKHERNYPPFLAEMAAAVYGMDQFVHHLTGRHFYLYTDHKPLVRLNTAHTKTLNRLQVRMNELHPTLRHINGQDNVVADFLSRYNGFNKQPNDDSPDTVNNLNDAVASISHTSDAAMINRIDATPFRMSLLQRLDPDIRDTFNTVKQHTRKSSFNSPLMFRPSASEREYTVINNVLYTSVKNRRGFITDSHLRVVTPQSMIKEILVEAHNSRSGGHAGKFKTIERIREEFWWPGMDKHVEAHLKHCTTCQRVTNKGQLPPPPPQDFPQTSQPNERIHIDLFGPLKNSVHGNNYVLVITDAFTKFARVVPTNGKAAPIIAQALLDHMHTFGVPQSIVSDQGLEFCNALQRTIWDSLNIEHKPTTPYHPQCNGAAEVFNKTMKHYLATAIADSDDSTLDWELYLGPLMLSYNTAISASTKVSPFQALFAYNPRLPLWDTEFHADEDPDIDKPFPQFLAQLRRAQALARKVAHHNDQHSKQQARETRERTRQHHFPDYQPGDKVWIRIHAKNVPNPKLAHSWTPAIVLEQKSAVTFKVQFLERARKKKSTVNVANMKPRLDQEDTASSSGSDSLLLRIARDNSPIPRAQSPRQKVQQWLNPSVVTHPISDSFSVPSPHTVTPTPPSNPPTFPTTPRSSPHPSSNPPRSEQASEHGSEADEDTVDDGDDGDDSEADSDHDSNGHRKRQHSSTNSSSDRAGHTPKRRRHPQGVKRTIDQPARDKKQKLAQGDKRKRGSHQSPELPLRRRFKRWSRQTSDDNSDDSDDDNHDDQLLVANLNYHNVSRMSWAKIKKLLLNGQLTLSLLQDGAQPPPPPPAPSISQPPALQRPPARQTPAPPPQQQRPRQPAAANQRQRSNSGQHRWYTWAPHPQLRPWLTPDPFRPYAAGYAAHPAMQHFAFGPLPPPQGKRKRTVKGRLTQLVTNLTNRRQK